MASGYTTSQAARLLGVGRHEVARLVRNGILRARKTDSGTLAIDPDSVHAHEALSQFKGRPWSPQTAWAALLAGLIALVELLYRLQLAPAGQGGWALAGISVNARQPLPWLLAAAVAAAGGAAIAVMRRGK